jgi:hypothetical protein
MVHEDRQKRTRKQKNLVGPVAARHAVARAAARPRLNGLNLVGGGDEATRTPNPRLAKAVLYQLSYVPGLAQREASDVASRHSAALSCCACRRLAATAAATARTAASSSGFLTRTSSTRRYRRRFQSELTRHAAVGLGGLEPPASSLSGMRSNRLSYRPGIARKPLSARATSQHIGRGNAVQNAFFDQRSDSVISMPPTRSAHRL